MTDRESIMLQWDKWREYIKDGGGGSWPREDFESLLDEYDEECDRLRAEVERLKMDLDDATKGREEYFDKYMVEKAMSEMHRQAEGRAIKRAEAAEAKVERLSVATEKLVQTATLLYHNATGCAVNHHAIDFAEQGLPGWLHDAEKDIADASAALAEEE